MEKEKTYRVDLTLEELELLDGKVSEKAQKVIEQARVEKGFGFELPIMNEILRKSLDKGTLTWTRKSIRSCSYCNKVHSYQRYARNSRYHNKGDFNYDKPLYYSGIAFNEGFVTFQGVGDMCMECCQNHQVIEQLVDYIVENDLKIQVQSNQHRPGTYLKDPIYVCKDCEKEFPESTMGREPAVFSGTYPSRCPHCDSSKTSKELDKFSFVLNPLAFPEVIQIEKTVEGYNEGVSEKDKGLIFFQSQRNKHLFLVERKYSNRLDVLRFNTEKRSYSIKHTDPALESEWKRLLEEQGYTRNGEETLPTTPKRAKR